MLYGDQSKCKDFLWRQYSQDSEKYRYSSPSGGKPIRNPILRAELTKIFEPFLSIGMIKKLVPCSSTQRNDSFNSLVATDIKVDTTVAVEVSPLEWQHHRVKKKMDTNLYRMLLAGLELPVKVF